MKKESVTGESEILLELERELRKKKEAYDIKLEEFNSQRNKFYHEKE